MSNASQVLSIQASYSRCLALAVDRNDHERVDRNDHEKNLASPAPMLAEALIRFSPRLTFRETETAIWFFLDLGSHQDWIERHYADDAHLLAAALHCLESLGHKARGAIADTPQAAQALAMAHGFWLSSRGRSRDDLARLPLSSLLHLEGLEAWAHPSRVDAIANFFSLLGFYYLGDLSVFTESAFHERWGTIGDLVYKRLLASGTHDPQPISPYVPTAPLKSFVPLDFPVSIASLLLHEIDGAVRGLFARLEGRRLIVRRLVVRLRCEYSDHEHRLEIEPSLPSRDRRFFMTLLENRLERVELTNPIRDLELEVEPLPEKEQQDGFFNQQAMDHQKLALLTSLLGQEGVSSGFAVLRDEVWPERKWELATTPLNLSMAEPALAPRAPDGELDETGYAPLFRYGEGLNHAPRPTLLLKDPVPLDRKDLSSLHFLSGRPVERIEHGWWEERAGPDCKDKDKDTPSARSSRDYFVARDRGGRNLWLYQDRESEKFYLHGAFD